MQKIQVQLTQKMESMPELPEQAVLKLAKAKEIAAKASLGIPPLFQNKTLDNFIGNTEMIKNMSDAISNGQSIFLTGSVGAGKTHVACGLMRQFYVSSIKVEYDEYFSGCIDFI